SKNLQTGVVTSSANTSWIQFTKSHWAVLVMEPGRKGIAEYQKLSVSEQRQANCSRIWNDANEQLFQARAGSYRLAGDKIYHTATIAMLVDIIGIERVLKITKFDKTTLVVQTEFPDAPNYRYEFTYRRLD